MNTSLVHIFFAALALLICLIAKAASAQVYSYDGIGRLTNVSYANGASISYAYDPNGNITRISHRGTAANQPPDGRIDTPIGDITIEAGQSVDFTATVGDADGPLPLTVRWDFDGGAVDADEEDPGPVIFANTGSYSVVLNVVDGAGAPDPIPASIVVTVTPATSPPPANPPNSPRPRSGGGGAAFWLSPFLVALVVFRRVRRCLPAIALLLVAATASAADWAPMSSPVTENLNDVWGPAEDNVFAVGDNGTILHFDGSDWAPMASGVTADLNAVWGRSANEVYAVGDGNTWLRFDGVAWVQEDIGVEAANFVDVWSAAPGEPLWVLATNRAWSLENGVWTPRSFALRFEATLTPPAKLTDIGGTANFIIVTGESAGINAPPRFFVNFRDIAAFDTRAVHAFSDTEMVRCRQRCPPTRRRHCIQSEYGELDQHKCPSQ